MLARLVAFSRYAVKVQEEGISSCVLFKERLVSVKVMDGGGGLTSSSLFLVQFPLNELWSSSEFFLLAYLFVHYGCLLSELGD